MPQKRQKISLFQGGRRGRQRSQWPRRNGALRPAVALPCRCASKKVPVTRSGCHKNWLPHLATANVGGEASCSPLERGGSAASAVPLGTLASPPAPLKKANQDANIWLPNFPGPISHRRIFQATSSQRLTPPQFTSTSHAPCQNVPGKKVRTFCLCFSCTSHAIASILRHIRTFEKQTSSRQCIIA
jgi:hypothetical protein